MESNTTITRKEKRKNFTEEKKQKTRERKIQFNQCRPFISLKKKNATVEKEESEKKNN